MGCGDAGCGWTRAGARRILPLEVWFPCLPASSRAGPQPALHLVLAGLPEHRKLQQEADARFEEQKRREEEQEEKEQQQAEEAAAAQATADLEAMAAADLEAAAAAEAEAAALPPPPPKAKRGRKATGPTVTNPMAKRRSRKDADMEP